MTHEEIEAEHVKFEARFAHGSLSFRRNGDAYETPILDDMWDGWLAAKEDAREDADANAPWLSAAHALCSDMGVPQGNISERIEALRGVMEEARKDAERYRWLRDDGADILAVCEGLDSVDVGSTRVAYTYEHQISGPYLDAAIDAAIAKETK